MGGSEMATTRAKGDAMNVNSRENMRRKPVVVKRR